MKDSEQGGLPAGRWVATGTGSMPGTDPLETAAIVAGELPGWPFLPELPARGPGADMVGRAMGVLCEVSGEFAVETSAVGWQRTAAPGSAMRRAGAYLRADLDAAAERLAGYRGPFTVALAGPWTLAASICDQWGERTLRDRGFVADLCAAHAEAGGGLLARVRRAVPGASPVLVVDEPALWAVHTGQLPFSSGYRRHAPVLVDALVAGLRPIRDEVAAADASFGVHTCAAPVWPVLQSLRPDWLSLDVALLTPADTEPFGTWLEGGSSTVWGVWPTTTTGDGDAALNLISGWLRRLGTAPSRLPAPMGVSPRCGLAATSRAEALAALRGVSAVAKRLAQSE